ncbi:MAG: hypothetical protein CSB15_00830 [Clostridiales bacterium]|nr:MAG: hypothetical protein CSB15_00830 [Clostridiales bacterium]
MKIFSRYPSRKSLGIAVCYLVLFFVLMIVFSFISINFLALAGIKNNNLNLNISILVMVISYVTVIWLDEFMAIKQDKYIIDYEKRLSELNEDEVFDYETCKTYKKEKSTFSVDVFNKQFKFDVRLSVLLLIFGIVMSIIFNYVFKLLDPYLPISEAEKIFSELFETNIVFVLVSALIIAPIFEELFFRKVIFIGLMKNGMERKYAVLTSALFFGIFHLNIRQFILATILGIVLANIVYYTGKIYYSMIFHFAFNGFSTFISMFLSFNKLTILFFIVILAVLLFSIYINKLIKNNKLMEFLGGNIYDI